MKLRRFLKSIAVPIALTLTILAVPIYSVEVYQNDDYTDFGVYYLAAKRAQAQHWDALYNLGDGASPFRYAPVTVPFFRPLAEFSPRTARMIWLGLQFLWFGLGFWILARALRRLRAVGGEARWIVAAATLFVFRFCLDTLTIGQVSGVMFLGFALGLYGWMHRRPILAGVATFIPTLFKIGPGILYVSMGFGSRKARWPAWFAGFFSFIALNILAWAWLGSLDTLKLLWTRWLAIVAQDSLYYDASHYGSQSIKSFLLRGVKSGWFSLNEASTIYLAVFAALCLGAVLFWALRQPRSPRGRGLFFAGGIFLYLWLMPETFKYNLTALAIPAALLLANPRPSRFSTFALSFGLLTLSLAGHDIIQRKLFLALQFASVPLLATLFLGAAVFFEAWRESRPSFLGRRLREALFGGGDGTLG